jgi:hypothetical protein
MRALITKPSRDELAALCGGWRIAFNKIYSIGAPHWKRQKEPLEKIAVFGTTLTLLFSLALWQQQAIVAAKATINFLALHG